MTQKAFFLSDLHLFSRRSHALRHTSAIAETAAEAEIFVLGGDIFDFRWTRLSSVEKTIDAAIDWLGELVDPNFNCEFHFVLGNHDFNAGFMQRLDRFADQRSNFSWERYYVRLGHSLFLHGDVANRPMDHETLVETRKREMHDKKRGLLPNMLYDAAVGARLHKVASSLVHPNRRVAKRLTTYLQHIGQGPRNGLRNVYFGHTHNVMSHYHYEGLIFHNGGAPIKGLDFHIIQADIF